mgnify:CR=1 FL=1|tara:strand:+ start:651 stop:872 length:222 start_codon:yes stop_codon:yes gene_type:complete
MLKQKLKKYVCMYYGWITQYGDWDVDSFHIMAYDKKEAIQKANTLLQNTLLKGKPQVITEAYYNQKMKQLNNN